jgi:hypothetical protein
MDHHWINQNKIRTWRDQSMASSSSTVVSPFVLLLFLLLAAPIYAFIKVTLESRARRSVKLTEDSLKKFEGIFAEPTERYIASLGNGYIINFLANSSLASGFAVISNKRVYFKGKCYYKEDGKLKKSFEERTVDLKDVTGTGYTRVNPTHLLITALVSLLVGIIGIILIVGSFTVLQGPPVH